jgi:hypothetical protein
LKFKKGNNRPKIFPERYLYDKIYPCRGLLNYTQGSLSQSAVSLSFSGVYRNFCESRLPGIVLQESLHLKYQSPTMAQLKYLIVAVMAIGLFAACKDKKKPTLLGDKPVEVSDFIESFATVNLPFLATDSIFKKKDKDSFLINNKIFNQFVPDSVIGKVFGKNTKPKIYSLGKAEVPDAETYLFIKAYTNEKKSVMLLSFDKQSKFIASMVGMLQDQNVGTMQSFAVDKKYAITKTVQLKNPDGSMTDGKDVYVLNVDAKDFMLIMTDALGDKVTELTNPIDTLTRKHKFAADYGTGKMNLVSIRDGKKSDRLQFFVHFEKEGSECKGELRGEATIISPTTAEYREGGDPCILTFTFSSSSVSLSEQSCGSHREGLKCGFDGSFPKKKWVKPSPAKTDKPSDKKKTVKK